MSAQQIADEIRQRGRKVVDWLLAKSLETYAALVVGGVLGYALGGWAG